MNKFHPDLEKQLRFDNDKVICSFCNNYLYEYYGNSTDNNYFLCRKYIDNSKFLISKVGDSNLYNSVSITLKKYYIYYHFKNSKIYLLPLNGRGSKIIEDYHLVFQNKTRDQIEFEIKSVFLFS